MFGKKCFGNLRSEVSKIYTKCITSCFFDIFQSLNHMDFTLYDTDWTFVDIFCIIFFSISFYKSFSSVYGKAFWETVTAYSNDSNFYFWHVIHDKNSSILYSRYFMFRFLVHDQSIPTFLIDSDILTLQSVECAFDSCFFVTDQPFIHLHDTVHNEVLLHILQLLYLPEQETPLLWMCHM